MYIYLNQKNIIGWLLKNWIVIDYLYDKIKLRVLESLVNFYVWLIVLDYQNYIKKMVFGGCG